MKSVENVDSASSSSTLLYSERLNMTEHEIDHQINEVISSLRLETLRRCPPKEGDDERLKRLHWRVEAIVNEEPDDNRRRRLRSILPAANCVREQLLYLRARLHSTSNPNISSFEYIDLMHSALTSIMKESFDEEYRKLSVIIGVLDAVAESLVLELSVFGVECPPEHRPIRKLLASSLTNLSFGNARSKHRLCSYPDLIGCVVNIINECQCLVQVYSGLLRNLSWMADAEMSSVLSASVAPLVRASLRSYQSRETKCLCATLSALWNLASHSRDNKRAICEESGCLEMLIDLLTTDAQQTAIVEPASGVLKYASMYLAVVGAQQYLSSSTLHTMVLKLVDLLNSPSFTIIGNGLGVLSQMLAKDQQLRLHLRKNSKAMQLLTHLRNSAREDIRNPVKVVLDYVHSTDLSGTYPPPFRISPIPPPYRSAMSASYGDPSVTSSTPYKGSPRLLKYRNTLGRSIPSPNTFAGNHGYAFATGANSAQYSAHSFAPRPGDQRFASTSYQFTEGVEEYSDFSFRASKENTAEHHISSKNELFKKPSECERNCPGLNSDISTSSREERECQERQVEDPLLMQLQQPDDPSFEIEDSVRCTRCTSAQSLSSLLPGDKSAWDSCSNSALNSNRLSPASATDLPDSPTQCMPLHSDEILIGNISKNEDSLEGNVSKSENTGSCGEKSGQKIKMTTEIEENDQLDGAVTAVSKNLMSIGESSKATNSVDDEGDYGSFISPSDPDLLDRSIEAAMPKSSRIEINDEFLADMIERVQPKPSPRNRQRVVDSTRNFSSASTAQANSASSSLRTEDDDFLLQSIANVLPPPSTSRPYMPTYGSSQKNSRALTYDTARKSDGPRRDAVMEEHRNERKVDEMTSSQQLSNKPPKVVESKRLFEHEYKSCLSVQSVGTMTSPISEIPKIKSFSDEMKNFTLSRNLVLSGKSQEKLEVPSSLSQALQQSSSEDSDTLSEDSFSQPYENDDNIDVGLPYDIDNAELDESVIIDCKVAYLEAPISSGSRSVRRNKVDKCKPSRSNTSVHVRKKATSCPPSKTPSPLPSAPVKRPSASIIPRATSKYCPQSGTGRSTVVRKGASEKTIITSKVKATVASNSASTSADKKDEKSESKSGKTNVMRRSEQKCQKSEPCETDLESKTFNSSRSISSKSARVAPFNYKPSSHVEIASKCASSSVDEDSTSKALKVKDTVNSGENKSSLKHMLVTTV
ncbi:hypothetical protein AB6A40_002142 [Gnathostoma spinigerum]|uniref:Adenomatous polyposis coli protein n=1 Tax=Gnathostoma spinigerum TaxID=75299 RepID=A0ABD6EEX6_9BILA